MSTGSANSSSNMEVSTIAPPLSSSPRAGEWILILLLPLLKALSFSNRQRLGKFLGTIAGWIPSRTQKLISAQVKAFFVTDRNVRIHSSSTVPPIPTPSHVLSEAAQTVLEGLDIPASYLSSDQYVMCNDWPLIRSLLTPNQGAIALTAHLGNWEILAGYMAGHGVPLSVVGRRVHLPVLQNIVEQTRSAIGVKTIWRGSDRSLARDIIHDLRTGRVIAALIDQDTRVESIPITFFGQTCQTPVSFVRLGIRMNVPIVGAFIRRGEKGKFFVRVVELTVPLLKATNIAPEETAEYRILEQFHRHLEEEIRLAPSQWVWFHRQWRTRENGQKLNTSQYFQWLADRS